jgi:hypothetical protein
MTRPRPEDPGYLEYRLRVNEYERRRYFNLKQSQKWRLHWKWAKERCQRVNAFNYKNYGAKGIKFLLTKEEVRQLWIRDNAEQLTVASLDRKEPTGHYEFNNCRFIEHNKNCEKEKTI